MIFQFLIPIWLKTNRIDCSLNGLLKQSWICIGYNIIQMCDKIS